MSRSEPIDPVLFDRNRDRFPEEQLKPYWGKHVAWNAEGTHILAAGDSFEDVCRQLEEHGIDVRLTVGDYIHDPNTSYL
jgi:hypothetical protein